MRPARIATVGSFLLSAALVGRAFWSTPAMRGEVARNGAQSVIVFMVLLLCCSWPWFRAYSRSASDGQSAFAWLFSVVAVALCAAFTSPIANAPAEGLGYYVLFCVLLVWLTYPVAGWVTGPRQ